VEQGGRQGGKEVKDNYSAFPVYDSRDSSSDYECIDAGMSLRQYAAIHLRVPRSGDPELDAMIRESRRIEFAEKALGIITDKAMTFPDAKLHDWMGYAANQSLLFADAMLEEWENKQGGEAK
jgi:hypothetical protein